MFFGKSKRSHTVVIRPHNINGNGFDLLVVKHLRSEEGRSLEVEDFLSDPEVSLSGALPDIVKECDLKRQHATIVLPHSSYSHFTINRPNLPSDEIRKSLYWVSQDKLDNMPYHTPLLDSCFAPDILKGREHNKMHVFVAEDSDVRKLYEDVKKVGLKVDLVTVHEIATASLLRHWSQSCVVCYIDIPLGDSPSLIIVLDGDFVAYKKLPSINKNVSVDVKRDQFVLFWAEVSRQLNYYKSNLDGEFQSKIYGYGESWNSLKMICCSVRYSRIDFQLVS